MNREKEHLHYTQFYRHISSEYKVQSALYRFMVLAVTGNCFSEQRIYNTDEVDGFLNGIEKIIDEISDDVHTEQLKEMINSFRTKEDRSIKCLDYGTYNNICSKPMTERLERLMFMYGAGVITQPIFRKLSIIAENTDIDDTLKEAEELLIEQARLDNDPLSEKRILSEAEFQQVLECAVKTKEDTKAYALSFSEAMELTSYKSLVKVCDGRVKVIDKEFFIFLAKQNERFAYERDNKKLIEEPFNIIRYEDPEAEEENSNNDFEEEITEETDVEDDKIKEPKWVLNEKIEDVFISKNYESEYFPFINHPKRLLVFLKLYKQPYIDEFFSYMMNFNVSFFDYPQQYKRFVNEMLFTFEISSTERKRNVCGEIPNWFDYNRTLSESEQPQKRKITIAENKEDTEKNLMTALEQYVSTYSSGDDCIFEVYHLEKYRMFIRKGKEFKEVNRELYSSQLFDYSAVYAKIQEFVGKGNKITTERVKGTNQTRITIPSEFKSFFSANDLPFAEGIVREQCARHAERTSTNVIYSTLSDLKKDAHEKAEEQKLMAELAALAKKKAAEEKELSRKRRPGNNNDLNTGG